MTKVLIKNLVFLSILLCPFTSLYADSVKFLLTQVVYTDQQEGPLNAPEGVACSDQTVVLADTGNGRLLKYDLVGEKLSGEKTIKVSQLTYPIRVWLNSKGEIFVLDGRSRRIALLSPEGKFKAFLKPQGVPSPSDYVPRSLALDRDDNIYVLDIWRERVLVLDPEGKYKKQIPLPEKVGFISDLLISPQGEIFLIDCVKSILYSAARDAKSFSPVTKSLKDLLSFPTSMAMDKSGLIYIVDQNGGSIVLMGQDGSYQGRKLGRGRDEGFLYYPGQMCINDSGMAVIADRNNNRAQVFQ
jgi:hypothetical protein